MSVTATVLFSGVHDNNREFIPQTCFFTCSSICKHAVHQRYSQITINQIILCWRYLPSTWTQACGRWRHSPTAPSTTA